MHRSLTLLAIAPTLLTADEHCCEHDHGHGHPAHLPGSAHHPHLTINHPEKDGWFHLHPHLHAAIALGGSTADGNWALIQGGHAPLDDGFNLQGIELGAVMEFGASLSIHTNYNVFWDKYDGWDGEWEEAYAAVSLPGGLVLRGGQFLAPFGIENPLHLHDRAFVEPPISMIRLLGEEGLTVQGAELAWKLPGANDRWLLRAGYGQSRSHIHGGSRERRRHAFFDRLHGHDHHDDHDDHDHDEDDHDHDEDDHDDHDDHDHHHGHSHGFAGGGIYDVDRAYLGDGFFFARLETEIDSAIARRAGLSFAAGQNGFGRTTWIAGADVRGDGEWSGRPVWWQGELFYREVKARDAAGHRGSYDEFGIYLAAGCEFAKDWTAGTRLEWASGDRDAGNESRWRASAKVGRVFHLAEKADLHTRLQYSYDRLGGYGDEHSVWLQFVLNLGAAEHGHPH